jgi:hypothetical protein
MAAEQLLTNNDFKHMMIGWKTLLTSSTSLCVSGLIPKDGFYTYDELIVRIDTETEVSMMPASSPMSTSVALPLETRGNKAKQSRSFAKLFNQVRSWSPHIQDTMLC